MALASRVEYLSLVFLTLFLSLVTEAPIDLVFIFWHKNNVLFCWLSKYHKQRLKIFLHKD